MLARLSLKYFLARGTLAGIQVAGVAILTRLLAPADYGQYALGIAWASVAAGVAFQWLNLSILRYIPSRAVEDGALVATAMRLIGLASLASVATFAAIAGGLAWSGASTHWLWPVLCLTCMLGVFELTCQFAIAELNPEAYFALGVGKGTLALSLAAWLALQGASGTTVLWGLSLALCVPAAVFWATRSARLSLKPFDPGLARELLRYGLPLGVTMALVAIATTTDRIVVGWLRGAEAVGIYGSAYELASHAVTLLMVTVNYAAYPLAIRAVEQGQDETAKAQLERNAELLLVIGLPAGVGLSAISHDLAALLLGEAFRDEAAGLMGLIAIGAVLAGLRSYYYDLAFQLARQTTVQLTLACVNAALSVIATVTMVSSYGVKGAAYSVILVAACGLVTSAVVGRHYFILPTPWAQWSKVAVASAVVWLVLDVTDSATGLAALIARVGGALIVYIVLLALLDIAGVRAGLGRTRIVER